MIGINDLLRGMTDETILRIRGVADCLLFMADSQIVVHRFCLTAVRGSSWAGRSQENSATHYRIRQLNRQLQAIAQQKALPISIYIPSSPTPKGNLRADLSTDGLHLNFQGYLVWRSALQTYYSQLELEPRTEE